MEQDKTTLYPALNRSELANKYGVPVRTINKWIKPFKNYIDKKDHSKTFTPDQVKRIVEKLGPFFYD